MVTNWAMDAFSKTATAETLRHCPIALVSLDGKLMTGITIMLKSSKHPRAKLIDQNINLAMQEVLETYRSTVGGRHGLWVIAKQFTTSDDSESYLGTEHLSGIEVHGGDLENFWLSWRRTEGQLHPAAITAMCKEQLLYRGIHDVTSLTTIMAE